MGNILNFNVNKIDVRLSNAHYWDLYLAKGDYSIIPKDTILSGDCLVAHYDFDEPAIYAGTGATPSDRLLSLTTWTEATNDGFILPRIGLTGIDNGLITFNKVSGDTGNTALLSALTASTLVIPSGETRLNINRVTGMTGDFIYPMEIIPNTANQVGDYAKLCGGFYQGYYKLDGYNYEILPNRVPKGWTAEFWLRPNEDCLSGNTGTTTYAVYSGTPLFKYDSQRVVRVTIENHGMSVGDIITVTATTNDVMFLPNFSPNVYFTTVTNILDDDNFEYIGSTAMLGFDTSGTGTVTLYDTTCYSGISLTKYSGDKIEVPISGLTTNDYVSVTGITPSILSPNFTPVDGSGINDGYRIIYSASSSGFTYQTSNLTLPVPEYATGTVCTYSIREINETKPILNDVYTNNSGFFLYFGTRAENKFWNQFEGLNTGTTSGCTSGATEWCTIPKEIDVSFTDDEGHLIPLDPPAYTFNKTDNNFLIYSRGGGGACGSCGSCSSGTTCTNPFPTSGGKTVCNWTGGSYTFTGITQVVTDDRNPFLVYSRASGRCGGCNGCNDDTRSGETVCSFSGFTSPLKELDKKADIIDNAIGFRITEDGRIGYRKLILTASCVNEVTVTGVTIEEQYSATGMVVDNQWQMISIRFVADTTLDECELEWKPARKGKLMFYVNRRLKFIVKDFDEFIARRLFEHKDKQLGVPYNISLGGGSQGLLESMTFDGQDPDDLNCIIQNNFAGTFIGDISQFRFYICDLSYCDIVNNYEQEVFRYSCTDCPEEEEFYLLQENGGGLLQEDGFYILNESQFLLQENGDLLLQENGDNLIE